MNRNLQSALFERYPLIFSERNLDPASTAMGRGIEAGDGWFDLLDALCAQLQDATESYDAPQVVASQVKEKLGSLRFRVRAADERQRGAIAMAEAMSTRLCEDCGAPAFEIDDGWLRPRCARHATPIGRTRPRIKLTIADIESTLPRIGEGLKQYLEIQNRAARSPLTLDTDADFQKQFNRFYRSGRLKGAHKAPFFHLMEQARHERLGFDAALLRLFLATGKHYPSWASKLVATFDTTSPVIDDNVLTNLGLGQPSSADPERKTQLVIELHDRLRYLFDDYLASSFGGYLTARFAAMYPDADVSNVKKLDLVLWKYKGYPLV